MSYWICGADERQVAGDHSFVCGRRARPCGRARQGGRNSNCAGKLPVSDMVHNVREDLDWKIGTQIALFWRRGWGRRNGGRQRKVVSVKVMVGKS
jgi:hypothetical protein